MPAAHAWLEPSAKARARVKSGMNRPGPRTVVKCPPGRIGAEVRHDQPLSFAQGARRFASRTVRTGEVPPTDDMISVEETLCF